MKLTAYTSEFSRNLKIAYPIMLGQLGHVLVGLADNLMVGKLGPAPLASTSLANGFIFIFLSLGVGFAFSITTLVAEADGEKNTKKVRSVFQNGMLLSLICGVIILLLLFLAKPLLYMMKQPEEVVDLAIPYYHVIAFSMIPTMLFQGLKQFSDGLSETKYAMRATIIANIFNVLFNYVLIYGVWFFPKLGVVGAAYGTLISRIIMLGIMVFYVNTKPRLIKYTVRLSLFTFQKEVLHKIFNLGYPTALQMWFEVNLFVAGILLSGVLGTNPQAANQIALNLASMTFMIAVGLGVTATVRVGNQKGLNSFKELRRIALSIFLLMILIDLFFALGFVLLKDLLPTFYVHNQEVVSLASKLIVIAGFFQFSDGVQVVVLGALRGLQDVKIPMLITFISYWVVGFPICYYLGLETDLKSEGIWYGLLISLTCSAVMLYLRFNYKTKKLILENNGIT